MRWQNAFDVIAFDLSNKAYAKFLADFLFQSSCIVKSSSRIVATYCDSGNEENLRVELILAEQGKKRNIGQLPNFLTKVTNSNSNSQPILRS